MPIPSTIRVKVSSEAAESISLSPVVAQDMSVDELLAVLVSGTGKDAGRVREILQRGSFISGASRFRWDRLDLSDVSNAEVARLLASFPDPDPQRPFDPSSCKHVLIRGPVAQIEIDSEAARRKRLFRRRSLWDEILELAQGDLAQGVAYAGYSYKEAADVYRVALDLPGRKRLLEAAQLSPYSSISRQIEAAALDTIEFFVKR